MGTKRKSSASAGRPDPPPAKRVRSTDAAEFTGARFKFLLRDSNTAMKGLEMFIAKAKLLPSNEQYDVVEGYIKVSIECVEIFKLLDGERRPDSEMLLIFQALENILLRTASDLSHFRVVGMNIVKKLINSYMKLIYAALYSETHRLSRLCLTLLSAMVTQGSDAARDVYSHFDFNNKFLPNLVKKRDYKGKPDIRTAYIQYAISFLIAGDHSILVQVLELKDFIPDIIRTGLKEDRISTINLLLSTLETKVVLNKDISKTQKVHFFTSEILNHIASLYRWNGITDVSTVDVKASQECEEPGKLLVRELVHKFLMNLCCSLKHGINFYDPSLGTSGRGGNLVLLRFLLSLKTAVEDEMIADLMVNIFKVCPDLLNRYFKESQYSFVPRLKSAWLDNMKLLRKIYEAQPDISNAFKTTEFIPLPKLLSMVKVTTVPAVCNKAMFTQGLNIASKTVKHTIFSLITTILKRALKNIDYCQNEKIWEKSEIYTPLIMKEFVQQYREALSKLLPDMTSIIAVWQSFLKQDKAQEGQKEKGTEAASYMEETNETNKEHGLDDVEITLLKAVLLQVICLYQQVVPHLVAQSNFDFSKLIKGIFTEKGLQQEISPVLHYHILKLALELPANKFSWFRIQDASEKVCGDRSVFYLLMKMFVTSPHLQLKIATKKLIFKVLHDSGVFEYTGKELELWLSHLDNTVETKKEIVIQFLERVLVKVVTNPYPYTDKAADFVQEASILQVNLFKQDVDNISIPISHIDDVLDMIDVLVEDTEGLNEEIGCTLSEDMIVNTFPFSAIVPASLEARNKLLLDENTREESIVEYLIAVFTDLLNSQRDPLALCLMFQHYDKELQSVTAQLCQFNCYYNLWIPQQVKEALFQQDRNKSVDEVWSSDSSFFTLLKNSYQKGVAVLLDEDIQTKLNEAISQLQPQQLSLALKHVLLYLKTTVENFGSLGKNSGLSLVTVYMDLLKSLLRKGDDTELRGQPEQKNTQIEPELFMEAEILIQDSENDKIMEEMLSLVFKHPILENWFLAIEQHSLPPHSLNPIKVKLLSSHLNRNILDLLKMSCPLLQFRNQLDILYRYFEAVTKTVLEELHCGGKEGCRISPKKSLQIEALQELHIYMNTDQLKEIMLQLCKANLKSETLAGKKICLNIHGQTLMQLLTDGYQRGSLKGDSFFSREHIQGMSILLSASITEELEKVFMCMIQKEPIFAQAVDIDVQLLCLKRSTEISLSIVALLIQYSHTHLLHFELWCLKSSTSKFLKMNAALFMPLVNVYLDCQEKQHFKCLSKAVKSVLREALWPELLNNLLKVDSSQPSTMECHVLSKLLPLSDTEAFTDLTEKLTLTLERLGNHEQWIIADAVSRALETSAEKVHSWGKHLLVTCMKWLILSFSSSQEQETYSEVENTMLLKLENLLNSVTQVVPDDWNSFVKLGLKYRYKDQTFLKTLNAAINVLYQKENSFKKRLTKPEVLYMMITQHSLFLSTMLRPQEGSDTNAHLRETLVNLLLSLVKLCPEVCESNHFAVLLGAYGATLNISDQKILFLLKLYENNGLSLLDFRILLWGPAAVEHHKTCKSLGKSLWQQPSMQEIMCLLDREIMMRTILHFPQDRRLLSPEEEHMFQSKGKSDLAFEDLYDPCFLLQLFSELLRPECVVACHKFVEVNALGLTVAALSSYDSNMRAAAYHVLSSFRSHLEVARFREQKQLLYLMDVVQNGIKQPNLKFTFPLTLYIARVAQQILKPEEHMYTRLNRFLLSHQYLDLRKVPGFFHLFYSFDSEHKMEREWVLAIIGDGLRDKNCYQLYDYQRIFHVILSFFHSPLCDEATQYQILEILQNAAYITKAAYELIRDHSLLTWLLSVIEKRFLENKLLIRIISLINTLWETNLGNKQTSLSSSSQLKELKENQKFLPIQLINEFLHVLLTLLNHIRTNLDPVEFIQFFNVLSSVLEYRTLVIEAFREMGRFIVNEHILSNNDVLTLLYKWSIISKDMELQDDLHVVAQQYQIKELLRNTDRNKPRLHSQASNRLAQRRSKIEIEAAAISVWKEVYLNECRTLLRSVFIHWEPVLLETSAKSPTEQKGYSNPDLTCKITYLVFRWLVTAFLDSNLNIQNALLTFWWFKKCGFGNNVILDYILKDGTLKRAIFKLYSSIFNASEVVKLSELSVVNGIMLHLLESQGLTENNFHGAVKKFCLTEVTKVNKAASIFLTSIYIGDIWLGARQPDMFMTHIKLICGATNTERNDKKRLEFEDSMVSLCKDIYSFLSLHCHMQS
ncbi:nucleolar pre-ribosomal-associated protein 1 [Pituophis catenifer annectens]|uniref:nucleolar pre-ribosomal-associated protein 1 n=1 Tax=Pituophis catenifer annectens TaxID=94852 RepID=UPI0039965E21